MLENMLRPYLPHLETARDKCSLWGEQVLVRLDRIRCAIEDGNAEPSMKDSVLRIGKVGITGVTELDKVPTNQVWVIDYVAASGPWTLLLNGALFLGSSNGYGGATSAVLMPGEVASISVPGATDIMIQVTRKFIDGRPARARSGGGNEGVFSSTGPGHEGNRDIIDTGVPSAVLPVAGGSSDV